MKPIRAPLAWFRFDTKFAFDPRVQQLDERDQRRYVMLWCLAAAGIVPSENEAEVAFALRIGDAEAVETKRTLLAAGLIRDDWVPKTWKKTQFKSDHDGAQRMRRLREKQRKDGRKPSDGVMSQLHHGDVTVTPYRTGQNSTGETKTDRTEMPPPTDVGVASSSSGAERREEKPPYGNWDEVGRRVIKGIQSGIRADDIESLVRHTHCTVSQVTSWIRQNGIMLPKPKRRDPTQDEIAEARRKSVEHNKRQLEKLGLGNFGR